MQKDEPTNFKLDINEMNEILINTFKSVAIQVGLTKKISSGQKSKFSKPWYDKELQDQKRKVNRALKDCHHSNFAEHDRTNFAKLKSNYKQSLRKNQRNL